MRKTWIVSALALFALIGITAPAAHAGLDLNAEGAASLLGGAAHQGYTTFSPMIGFSALVGLTPFTEIGPFYENNFVKNGSNSGHQQFYGGMLRFTLIPLLFLDAQVGVSSLNNGAGYTTDNALSFGGKIAYQISFTPVTSISPFVGYRYLPSKSGSTSVDGNTVDFGLIFTFGL